ncbi:MAG: hypothetical protein SH809_09250 [Rhodothermales bacterium]|nr:hypothetical protein [Rhodothermales bacterium]
MNLSIDPMGSPIDESAAARRRSSLETVIQRIAKSLPDPTAMRSDVLTLRSNAQSPPAQAVSQEAPARLDESALRTKTFLATEAIRGDRSAASSHAPEVLQSFMQSRKAT